MAISLDSIKRNSIERAPFIVIHGPPGAGKTTFAAGAEKPIFIRAEDGLGALDVDAFPVANSYQDIIDSLAALFEDGHGYKTVVIDSLSALEPMIWARVAADAGVKNLEDIGFGKGYMYAMDYWQDITNACKGLAKRGITPILIAHSEIRKHDAPDADPYDRYQIKLHKRAFALMIEQADVIGFAHVPVHVKKSEESRNKAVRKGSHQLQITDSPAVVAKNRYNMPENVALDWDTFAESVPFYKANQTTNEEESNG